MPLTVIEQNVAILAQAIDLLDGLSDPDYAEPPPAGGVAPVGPHFRHCLDFYRCLIDGLDRGEVDYDRRGRSPELEVDRRAAISALTEITHELERLPGAIASRRVRVRHDVGKEASSSSAEEWSRSSAQRELQFLLSHTVHHFALIGLLLERRGVEMPADFGVAPSTLDHRRSEARCAR